jgi:hypothetical protein
VVRLTERNGAVAFAIKLLPLREVIARADAYTLSREFGIGIERTRDTTDYVVFRRKGCLDRLLMMSPDFYRVRLSVRQEEGEEFTRLSITTSRKGRWPDVPREIEQWIIEEIGGTPGAG